MYCWNHEKVNEMDFGFGKAKIVKNWYGKRVLG